MFEYRGRISRFGITMLLSVSLLGGVCLGAGPSLIVTESDYAELRARASLAPWATMKAQALNNYNAGYGTVGTGDYERVQSCLTSSTLRYVLEDPNRPDYEANQAAYRARIYDGIVNQLDNLNIGDSYQWHGAVAGGNTVFCAIHALDVVRDDLTTAERTACENKIQSKVNTLSTTHYWPLAAKGVHGTWDIYNGDTTYNPDTYYNEVMEDITSGGVFKAGSAYAVARYGQDFALVKSMFIDVLEHTGVDNRYYGNSQIQNFHEWIYTATVSPFKRLIPFGDTTPGTSVAGSGQVYRAAKFGDKVAGHASWFTHDGYPPRDLYFSYVVPDTLYVDDGKVMPAATALTPKSKVYMEGGGWFWENNVTEKSLMGAVWAVTNIPTSEGHAHKESNAIYMAAYGEHVLLNSGYPGYDQSWGGYSWNWFNKNARSANTVLVNNADHTSKCGGGLEEGFTSSGFDYSCSNDGPALYNDTHLRSFIFVKPQDGKNGYFLLFDEVDADPTETVNVLLHPNTKATTGITKVSDKEEYLATIDGFVHNYTDVKLSVFYGTEPVSVTRENGGIAYGGVGTNFEGEYLNAQYGTDASGNVQAATVLFPHNDTHAKATMARLSGAGYNGASVDHGDGVVDYVLASDGVADVTCAGATFKAKSAVFRKLGSELGFYFVRDGWEFRDGDIGFEADSDISIHVDELLGMIRSDGTEVKFLCPYLQEVLLDGVAITPIASGDGWVSVDVAAGTHELELVVPEPASAAMLLLGALGMFRRRKR